MCNLSYFLGASYEFGGRNYGFVVVVSTRDLEKDMICTEDFLLGMAMKFSMDATIWDNMKKHVDWFYILLMLSLDYSQSI